MFAKFRAKTDEPVHATVPNDQLEAMIDAIHRSILGRPVDAPSLTHWKQVIGNDLGRIAELLPLMFASREFSWRLGLFADRNIPSDAPFVLEHSQNGELSKLFGLILSETIHNPIVVDVGANGVEGSNSYDLLKRFGWRGLLIEANPHLIPRINDGFRDLQFTLVNAAVSNHEGEAELFLGIADGISSIHERSTSHWGPVQGTVKVQLRRLPDILAEHRIPLDFGLLSIDAESEDLNILNDTIDAGYRPQWIIFEAIVSEFDQLPLSEAVNANYRFAGSTESNAILRLY